MLNLGDKVAPYGELKAIVPLEHAQAGEWLYMFEDRHGTVSLMPAAVMIDGLKEAP